jgi:hypothetical protein
VAGECKRWLEVAGECKRWLEVAGECKRWLDLRPGEVEQEEGQEILESTRAGLL